MSGINDSLLDGNDEFLILEDDVKRYIEEANRKIKSLGNLGGEKRKAESNEIDRILDDAKSTLRKMGAAARNTPSKRSEYQMRIRRYDGEVSKLERALLMAVPNAGAETHGLNDAESRQRDKLITGVNNLDKSSDALKRTERTGLETEEIGAAVLSDLHGQREKLENADRNLSNVDDNMSSAKKKLIALSLKIAGDKIILGVIIGVQCLTIFLIVFFKWLYPLIKDAIHGEDTPTPTPPPASDQ